MVTCAQMEKIFKEIQPHFVLVGDADSYAGLFTSDAVWWPLNRSTRIGPAEIRAGVTEVLQGTTTVAVFEALEMHEADPVSFAVLSGTETISFHNGAPTQVVHSREIWMFREENGLPKICRMIWNQDPGVSTGGAPAKRAPTRGRR